MASQRGLQRFSHGGDRMDNRKKIRVSESQMGSQRKELYDPTREGPGSPCLSSLAGGKLITLLFWKLPIPICEVPCGAVYFCGLGLKAE